MSCALMRLFCTISISAPAVATCTNSLHTPGRRRLAWDFLTLQIHRLVAGLERMPLLHSTPSGSLRLAFSEQTNHVRPLWLAWASAPSVRRTSRTAGMTSSKPSLPDDLATSGSLHGSSYICMMIIGFQSIRPIVLK